MENFDAVEIITWVHQTVGGSIGRMIACPQSGVLNADAPGFREKLYLQATQFLASDTPLDLQIKKECVVQCMQRLESAAALRAKHEETRAIASGSVYWDGINTATDLLRSLSQKNAFAKMLAKECEQILISVEYINQLSTNLAGKIQNSQDVPRNASTKLHKA